MYVALCAVWGSTWLAIKIGLRDLPPLWFGGIRMALACVLLTPFALRARSAALSSRQRRWVAWTGLLQIGVAYACVFQGEEWIDSGLAALLFATFPAFVGVFAHFLLPDEKLRARTVAAAFERGAAFHWTASAVTSLLYLAICGTALPFVGLFWLLRRVPVAVIGTIPIVDTVLAILLGSLVLGESFSPRVWVGGAFILVSVLLAAAPSNPGREKGEIPAAG